MPPLSPSDREFFLKIFESAPVKRPLASIAQWVEGRRILPSNTPIPGPWRNSVTPYGIEIMDSLAPNSGIERVTVLKARKVGLTTIMENAVAYYMLENPSDILYSTANDDLAKDWGDRKIGYVIDSLGGRDKITANITNAKQRRTGDTSARKEYIGGALDIISSGSRKARHAMDKRCLFIDEVDGLAALTATGEGKWTEILFGHTAAWGARRKIAMFSSPTTTDASLISEYYEQGDCRHFFVPCPYCGEPIELRLDIDPDAAFGLKADTKDGEIINAYYVCEKCGEPIKNAHKTEMFSENPHCIKYPEKTIEKYRWQATRQSNDKAWRSYYINALYSPVGMLTFTDVAKARARAADGTGEDMRSYTNIFAGLPYKDAGSRPKLSTVIALKGSYISGTVPDGVLYLTAAVDVQAGSRKDPDNPPRLEMEVLGHGAGYRTWSITYKVFTGETDAADSEAWEKLYNFCKDSFVFKSKEGAGFTPQMMFIDSGNAYEGRNTVVYRFCERIRNTYPIKGMGNLTADARKGERSDIPGAGSFKKYRVAVLGKSDERVVEISTPFYKDTLYGNLKIERRSENPQRPGFCDFPIDYDGEYFAQLTGEEKLEAGGYRQARNRVEALDCRVYNLCAGHFYLDMKVSELKAEYKKAGAPAMKVAGITAKTVLDRLAANVSKQKQAALGKLQKND